MGKSVIISIYKLFFSFIVVCCHFWYENDAFPGSIFLARLKSLAVPMFVLLSFFLNEKHQYQGGLLD